MRNRTEFENKLRELINHSCMENDSNTPDFILATYLTDCLASFDKALEARELWYGRPIQGDKNGQT